MMRPVWLSDELWPQTAAKVNSPDKVLGEETSAEGGGRESKAWRREAA